MQTIGESFIDTLPAMAMSFIACYFWLLACRRIRRKEDAIFDATIEQSDIYAQRVLLGRGRPSDVLFLGSLMVAATVGLIVLAGFMVNSPIFTFKPGM